MKMTNNQNRKSETGSVFVFILIGIALFASVSYVVTQSLRIGTDSSGNPMGGSERNTVAITDIMQFLDALKIRVFQMTNTNNVPESQLDFRNDVYKRPGGGIVLGNINSSCGDETCRIFSPYSPNGLTPMIFKNAADSEEQTSLLYVMNGHGRVGEIDISGVGTSEPDLVFVIYGIKPAICNLYNAKQGITTTYTSATTLTSIGENSPLSSPDQFNGFTTPRAFGYLAPIFVGKKSFCAPAIIDALNHRLSIWHVLKIR